jgi:hypothetical protein
MSSGSEAQLGRKLREWGVYKYDSKHSSQPRGQTTNAMDSDGFGSATAAQPFQQSLSPRRLVPVSPKGNLVAPALDQICDLPDDGWYESVIRWLKSNEGDVRREYLPWVAVRNSLQVVQTNLQKEHPICVILDAYFIVARKAIYFAITLHLLLSPTVKGRRFQAKYIAFKEAVAALERCVEDICGIELRFRNGQYTE